jgi:ATP-dependent Clp protease ATP-binding subunit ClpC
MPEMTIAADMVWRIAAVEARRSLASMITVDHLLVGLLSLEKVLEPGSGLEPDIRAPMQADQDAIVRVLARVGQNVTMLRREIRRQLPAGTPAAGVIHRDAACKRVFARADALAHERGATTYGALHLLAAMLEAPPSSLESVLPSYTGSGPIQAAHRLVLEWITRGVPPQSDPSEPLLDRSEPGNPQSPSLPIAHAAAQPPGDVPSDTFPPVPRPRDTTPTSDPAALDIPRGTVFPETPQPPQPATPVSAPGAMPPALLRYGRDLTAEAEAGTLGPVIGRHDEMLRVVRVLRRRMKNSPVLIGEAGVGKTAVVEGLACRIAEGTALPGRRILALNLASVLAGTMYRGQFEERLEEILIELRAHPEIILFLDELHTIVGAGDREGRMDAANILKPALARGEIACIGATTTDEYQRHIASDAALERRFQPVTVAEPSPVETRAILEGLRAELERHHEVRIESAALDAAIELTVRYVLGRRLPDKAVDALDEACSRAGVPSLTLSESVAALASEDDGSGAVVSRETVGEVVSAWTGIPVGRIGQAEADRLADLDTRLSERVVGQQEAIQQVAGRVRLARTGMTAPDRPSGVFLFVGPSGVGKTELVHALAELAVDGPQRLIRLDMSEYGEKHAAARLVGAPPGYQGHGEEGQLTGPLRRNPHAIVLMDEAEKAHPEVFDLFLQLFDAGRLTDSSGRLVDGRQAIFVLTSNLPVSGAARRPMGFGEPGGELGRARRVSGGQATSAPDRESLLTELRQFFHPELLNRIDEIVLFRSLGESDLVEIADRQLRGLRRRLLDQHEIDLAITPLALGVLARRAAAGTGGARELQRIVTRLIETPLSRDLLAGEYMRGEQLIADVVGDNIVLVRDRRTF